MLPGVLAGARAALALAAALQAPAQAEPPRAAACPAADAVWADVAALVGRERVAAAEARPTLVLDDLGVRYRVVVAGRAHEYADAARDCDKRAQVAAVFVGLTLWPLEVATPPEPPPPPPPRASVALEVAPWLGVAAASGQSGVGRAAGARVGAALVNHHVGVVAGVGAELPVHLTLLGVPVDESRFPLDVGVRLRAGEQRVAFAFDAAAVAALVRASPAGGATTSWVDAAARATATLELRAAPKALFGFFLSIFAEMSPFARSLGLEPDGVVGHATWLRTGAALGISWKIR